MTTLSTHEAHQSPSAIGGNTPTKKPESNVAPTSMAKQPAPKVTPLTDHDVPATTVASPSAPTIAAVRNAAKTAKPPAAEATTATKSITVETHDHSVTDRAESSVSRIDGAIATNDTGGTNHTSQAGTVDTDSVETNSIARGSTDNRSPDADSSAREADTQIAMITKESRERTLTPDLSSLEYDIEHLPRTLPGGWVLDIRDDPLSKRRRCLLYSRKTPIFDGYDKSWLQLQVTNDAIVIRTDSNLDASYPNQGLRVDGGALVPFADKPLSKRLTYTGRPVQLAMANGAALSVSLGFWPTWPVTKTQTAEVDLAGFDDAYAALKACIAAQ